MRGFELTSMWLEEYKRAIAKNLKKRKGLHIELRETTRDNENEQNNLQVT